MSGHLSFWCVEMLGAKKNPAQDKNCAGFLTFWAADVNGNPTDDPNEALKGFLLPIAGFKGLGLAYVVDILCGVLTSGIFADKIKSMYRNPDEPSQIGHMMLAIFVPMTEELVCEIYQNLY